MVKIKNYETVKTVIGPKKAIDFLWGSSRRTVAQYVQTSKKVLTPF